MIQRYEQMDLVGGVFSIHRFQMEARGNYDFPRYGAYTLNRDEWKIVFSNNTRITRLMDDKAHGFPYYPKVPLLKTLADDLTLRRMIVGTF